MVSFSALKDGYEQNWADLKIRPGSANQINKAATKLLNGKATYEQVQAKTGVPWWFVGLCHSRESSFDFNTYLGNGQSLGRVTTIVPRGRGPFAGPNAFVDGCVDALRLEGFAGCSDWGIARTLYRLEGFNGYGYHNFGVNTPYLYCGSTLYGPPEAKAGKYVADHDFRPGVVDSQLGTAVILKALMALDPSITFDVASSPAGGSNEPDDELAKTVVMVQESLNRLGIANPPLVEDGINGRLTKTAISQFQELRGLTATGLPHAATIAALAKATTTQPGGSTPQLLDPAQILRLLLGLAGQQAPAPTPAPLPGGIPAPSDLSAILQLLQNLGQAFQAPGSAALQTGATSAGPQTDLSRALQQLQGVAQLVQTLGGAKSQSDPVSLIERLLPLMPKPAAPPASTTSSTASTSIDQLKQVVDLLNAMLSKAGAPALGQVNGALGETIGNLLNGKKTALGIGGSLLTTLLANVTAVPGSGGLAGLLGTVATAVPGLSQFTLPIFLAMTAWGVLGKMEKWAQGTAPVPKPQS